jgi:hypothetical protein
MYWQISGFERTHYKTNRFKKGLSNEKKFIGSNSLYYYIYNTANTGANWKT